jgi:hypothetical protein
MVLTLPTFCFPILPNDPYKVLIHIYEWIATFWLDWCEKLKVDLNSFWAVHFITLYVYVTQQKFPHTLSHISLDIMKNRILIKNATLHFSVYCKFLLNDIWLWAEIFTIYRSLCFVSTVKIRAQSSHLLESYMVHTVQGDYNDPFFSIL